MALQDTDRGWERIQKELHSIDGAYTKVGLPEEAAVAALSGAVQKSIAQSVGLAAGRASFSAMKQTRRSGGSRSKARKLGKLASQFVTGAAIRGKSRSKMSELVMVAVVNEFGSTKRNIPSRPAFRRAFDENRTKIEQLKKKLLNRIYEGTSTGKQALGLVGEFLTNKTKKKITDLKTPPNKPATIKRKGSSNPLIDLGQERASVTHVEVYR